MKRAKIVVDGTPIRGSSGHRGIGRFIYDLLHGLDSIRDEWRDDLELLAVEDIDWRKGCSLSPSPGEAAETLFAARGTAPWALVNRRRFLLDPAARAAGASILHLTEALGTPITHRVARVVTCHDLIPLRMPRDYLGRGLTRLLQPSVDARRYGSAERVVAISDRTRRDLKELLSVSEERIEVVHNGIDLSQWRPDEKPSDGDRLRALGLGQRPFVVYAGYWDQRKDVPTLLRAVAAARRTTNVELAWAGHFDDEDLGKLRGYLAAEGVLGELQHVRFLGFVSADDLAVLYRHALAHVFLSRLEGFGLSVAEAMACGCPVVVARASGADEVGGDAVVSVSPGDAAAAADAIVRFGRDPEQRRRYREAGFVRAAKFGRATMARGYLDVWRRTIAEQSHESRKRPARPSPEARATT